MTTLCLLIRLGGQKRHVESEKGAMEEKSLRNTDIELQHALCLHEI